MPSMILFCFLYLHLMDVQLLVGWKHSVAHSGHPQCAVWISTLWERTASKVTVSPLRLSLFLSLFLEIYCISFSGFRSSLLFLLFSSWGKGATL